VFWQYCTPMPTRASQVPVLQGKPLATQIQALQDKALEFLRENGLPKPSDASKLAGILKDMNTQEK